MLHNNKFSFASTVLLFCLVFSGCKKEATDPFAGVPRTGTRMQLTLDSIFLYASQVYLWREALPAYKDFAPRERYGAFTPALSAYRQELYDISQMKLNPQTGLPYEYNGGRETARYSFLSEGESGATSGMAGIVSDAALEAAVLKAGNKNVGYLSVASFPALADCRQALDDAFGSFAQAAVEDLVIDLRSNRGGYVSTVQYIADLLATPAMNGKKMFSEVYNTLMQSGGAYLLRQQPYLDENGNTVPYNGRTATMADVDYSEAGNTYTFSKKGSLGTVKNVYFIVSGATASAAEMLISVLKPYMNVTLIGERTYGKPVGFFALNIDVYSVYFSSFLIKNASGWYDYFEGMQPDAVMPMPGNPVLGHPDEPCLKKALELISSLPVPDAAIVVQHKRMMKAGTRTIPADKNRMVENRLNLR
ncbi:MAG: S41 family peptidase [Niabella sp.]